MKTNKGFYLGVLALGVAALIAACAMQSSDEPGSGAAMRLSLVGSTGWLGST